MSMHDENTIEMLRLRAPGELVHHREVELDQALPLMRQAVDAVGGFVVPEFDAASHYEQQVAQQFTTQVETPVSVRDAHQAQVADMGVYRASEAVSAAYDGGEGNPLFNYDQKAV